MLLRDAGRTDPNSDVQCSQSQGALPTANRLFKIIEEEPDFEETKDQFVENLESLRLNHISKSFAERQLFSDLTATISVGQKVLIKGPSGSGKTTLFA